MDDGAGARASVSLCDDAKLLRTRDRGRQNLLYDHPSGVEAGDLLRLTFSGKVLDSLKKIF